MSKTKNQSRPARWQDAVNRAEVAAADLLSALEELVSLQEEFQEWRDNLPENLQSGTLADKLEAVCDLELEDARSNVEDLQGTLSEADGMDLPRGFGRD